MHFSSYTTGSHNNVPSPQSFRFCLTSRRHRIENSRSSIRRICSSPTSEHFSLDRCTRREERRSAAGMLRRCSVRYTRLEDRAQGPKSFRSTVWRDSSLRSSFHIHGAGMANGSIVDTPRHDTAAVDVDAPALDAPSTSHGNRLTSKECKNTAQQDRQPNRFEKSSPKFLQFYYYSFISL